MKVNEDGTKLTLNQSRPKTLKNLFFICELKKKQLDVVVLVILMAILILVISFADSRVMSMTLFSRLRSELRTDGDLDRVDDTSL